MTTYYAIDQLTKDDVRDAWALCEMNCGEKPKYFMVNQDVYESNRTFFNELEKELAAEHIGFYVNSLVSRYKKPAFACGAPYCSMGCDYKAELEEELKAELDKFVDMLNEGANPTEAYDIVFKQTGNVWYKLPTIIKKCKLWGILPDEYPSCATRKKKPAQISNVRHRAGDKNKKLSKKATVPTHQTEQKA